MLLREDCETQIDISQLKAITGNTEDVPKICRFCGNSVLLGTKPINVADIGGQKGATYKGNWSLWAVTGSLTLLLPSG